MTSLTPHWSSGPDLEARSASHEVALDARRVMERRKRGRFPPAGSGDNVTRSQKHPPQKASPPVIFADSLPDAKAFFAAAKLPASTVGLLTRFVVACLDTLHSACQAADS